jgi:uncharacterized spore protein YtfJ
MNDDRFARAMATLDGVKDALNVRRVFGDAYEVGGVMVIPVAVVRGGGGGGGGEGGGPADAGGAATGSGVGMGWGTNIRPVGAYIVRSGDVTWQPSVDVMRIVIGGQILVGLALLTLRAFLRSR